MLYFITANKNKIEVSRKFLDPFGVVFKTKDLSIMELQSENIEEVVLHKANQAFDKLKKPLFVTDHFWSFPALNGFPGAYMKYMNKWLTANDFLNLMSGKNDRRAILTEMICFTDGKINKNFKVNYTGKILYKPDGKGLPGFTLISLSKDGHSISRKLEKDPSAIKDNLIWKEFAVWYKNYVKKC